MARIGTILLSLGIVLTLATACKKEVEIQVREVPKTYSWAETPHLTGLARVILGMGKDERALYLQSPSYLGVVAPGSLGQRYFLGYLSYLPADVNVRLPIAPTFLAVPQLDTLVALIRPTEPISNYSGTTIRLRQLDPRAQSTSYPGSLLQQTPFAAISAQNYLLFGYRSLTATNMPVLRLVLARVTLDNNQHLQTQSRVLDFPGSPAFDATSYVGTITAIDDYFLVDCGRNGGYKVRQDGTISRVYPEAQVATFYKWQGLIYAHTYRNTLLLSADGGETWRTFTNAPSFLSQSDFRIIADSLVGYVRTTHQLYTLRWSSPGTPRIRELKNDGMAQVTITGLEQLHDTVYAGTTGGLYRRPLKAFFEAAP
ncbi:MAG: hypothetical protein EOO62_15690 [Hymenobacter sp.]|nr:MAG: hypothetical protein EOO62_15690 [Hymenobacter sp.]